MIPDDVVERVREHADIVRVIGEYVKLKRVGTSYRGPCPFHHGKDPNFSISTRGGYKCFVCGESGDVFTFIQKHLGLDFVESVKLVGEKVGIEVREVSRPREEHDPRDPLYEACAAAAELFQQWLWDEATGAPAREYLESRGISRAEAERFGLGFAPRDGSLQREKLHARGYDDARLLEAGLFVQREDEGEPRPRFRGRLIFPIHDVQGRVIAFGGRVIGQGEPKYLNSPETPLFSKGRTLYGLHWARNAIRKADRALVVEGYMDAVRLMAAGFQEVVAPLGTALTEEQARALLKYSRNVFLLYDSDTAGLKATFRAGDELLRQGGAVQVVTLPEGEDPDTFVRAHGAQKLESQLSAAMDVFERKVQILERGGWFGDLRRKRKALDRLLPTIRATADPITRDLYLARASEAAGVSRDMLAHELEAPARGERPDRGERQPGPPPRQEHQGGRPAPRVPERRRSHTSELLIAERELIRALVHHPEYVEGVAERIGEDSFLAGVYRQLFVALVSQGGTLDLEQLAAGLDSAAVTELETLLQESGGLDDPNPVVSGALSKLQARPILARLAQIDRDAAVASGGEWEQLLAEKQRLQAELRELGVSHWKAFRRSHN